MTNSLVDRDTFESWGSAEGFASGNRPFFQAALNPSSQTESPVTLVVSQFLYNITWREYSAFINDCFYK